MSIYLESRDRAATAFVRDGGACVMDTYQDHEDAFKAGADWAHEWTCNLRDDLRDDLREQMMWHLSARQQYQSICERLYSHLSDIITMAEKQHIAFDEAKDAMRLWQTTYQTWQSAEAMAKDRGE